jgi:hypothetical protein
VEEQGGGVRAAGNDPTQRRRALVGRRVSRGGGGSGWVGPTWKREGACGPCLEYVGRPRRRKNGQGPKKESNFSMKSKNNQIASIDPIRR